MSDEVETVFCESEAKRSKLFKSKFGLRKLLLFKSKFGNRKLLLFKSKFHHKNLFRKSFWSNLELKSECCQRLKSAFFSFFCTFLSDKVETIFSEKVKQSIESHSNQNLVIVTEAN